MAMAAEEEIVHLKEPFEVTFARQRGEGDEGAEQRSWVVVEEHQQTQQGAQSDVA